MCTAWCLEPQIANGDVLLSDKTIPEQLHEVRNVSMFARTPSFFAVIPHFLHCEEK